MGESKTRRSRFLAEHPLCAFCGGLRTATTIEHCPPRAMFQHRQWPEGFEFPACDTCNRETSDADLLVATITRLDPIVDRGSDGRTPGLIKAAHAQHPRLFEEMMPTQREARTMNRELNIEPGPGESHQSTGILKVTKSLHAAVCIVGRKLAKALYYKYVQRPFPNEGSIAMHWFSSADLLRDGFYRAFDSLTDIAGDAPELVRSGKTLNDQFEYKFSLFAEVRQFALQVRFGHAFGLVIFASPVAGVVEDVLQTLRTKFGSDGPFALLQSASLPTFDEIAVS